MTDDGTPSFDKKAEEVLQDFIFTALEMQAEGIKPPLDQICKSRRS